MNPVLEKVSVLGASTLDVVREIGGVGKMLRNSAHLPNQKHFWRQMTIEGVNSIPIVFLLSFTIGLILAMQTAYYLGKFGGATYFPALVAIATVRELGPLIAAIIISGRVGASIAAELGTMVVAEEIDALRSMSLHPIRFLVVPRVLALVIMLPCLSMLANIASIVGAYVYGNASTLAMSWSTFHSLSFGYMVRKDISTGLIKSVVFALLISGISCFKGMSVSGGAEGVGQATTQSVVHSIFAIIIVDGIFTAIFTILFP